MSNAPVLDLTAVFKRATVKMPDGTDVALRNQQEFSVLEWHRLVKLDGDAVKLKRTVADSEADAKKISDLQREVVGMLVVDRDMTDEPDWVCAAILLFWAEQLPKAEVPPGSPPRSRRTTAASSRGSKPSTAATPKRGSTSRSGR